MALYIAKRLGMTSLVLLTVMVFLASLVHLIPGDAARIILGPRASPDAVARVREEMGLEDPVPVQVLDFIVNALRGDLGQDFVSRVPVLDLVLGVLPHTLILAAAALTVAAVLGVSLGVYAATHSNSLWDRLTALLSVSLITIPPYVAALLLLVVFAVQLGWFPTIGAGELTQPLDYLRRVTLPVISLAVLWIGYIARLVRTSMLEVLSADYIRTARAFGVSERRVVYRLALKNGIVPTVAVLGWAMGHLIGGSIFVEVIFNRPGLGRLIFDAIGTRNYPVVRGGVLFVVVLFVLANLVADLSYRWLDPRIRREEALS